MNITFFVPILDQVGGAELATWRLSEQMAKRSHRITILTTQPLSQWRSHSLILDYAKDIRLIRLPVWQRSKSIFRQILVAQALWAIPLFLRQTDIFHLRGFTPESLILAQIARRLTIKTICVPMASGVYGDIATFPASNMKIYDAFDWVSVLTEPLRDDVIAWGIPQCRTGVIPNGVDTTFFKPPERIIDEIAQRTIFVGQFRPEKRIDLLLHAWIQVQTQYPRAQLTLVGGGQHTKSYTELATHLGISPTFIANTDKTNVLAYLQSSGIFVMSGISEGMSNALLEAMAVGLAPIVADTPANRAVITPEFNGLSYPADSPEALAAQIMRLISDDDLRQRIAATARETVVSRFDLEAITEQYLALYAQLLGEKR